MGRGGRTDQPLERKRRVSFRALPHSADALVSRYCGRHQARRGPVSLVLAAAVSREGGADGANEKQGAEQGGGDRGAGEKGHAMSLRKRFLSRKFCSGAHAVVGWSGRLPENQVPGSVIDTQQGSFVS